MLVFLVIVGTGNHYVLDCVVGSLTFALATVVALVLHGPVAGRPQSSNREQASPQPVTG